MAELLGERAGTRGPTLAELEFFAEDSLVTVIPRVNLSRIELIAGDFGPFTVNEACAVPLWLAVCLKRAGYCSIVPPSWLRLKALTAAREEEEQSPELSASLPFHYQQIASLLLTHAAADIPQACHIHEVLEDIVTVRQGKIRALLQRIVSEHEATRPARLGYLGSIELFRFRPALVHSLRTQSSLHSESAADHHWPEDRDFSSMTGSL
ncbi:hypothetical protein, conserved [Cyanidioschyzon merolae strain 10D]|jgi:GINS complex subunit 2|uniref:Uncharacterized protein n=1 Tax=Cyanidioschyzon merolae (strain NIES-3377 / 10D) TaxID=280699 RepID=M1VGF5_CYAM1|nr:hypothetical protein, conserved [Cyanidioschyzon merolae strain 10D]BAM82232.1 hypothetical protein, conserved [Cyanidioschyzon merolae strain 10D]|eukprot:XP_005538268.1 hypothetical protein, conserved [Cyanidioschyzon merolae strain 10D]